MVTENKTILSAPFLPYGFFTLHDYATGMAVYHAAHKAGVLKPDAGMAPFGFVSAPGAAGFMGMGWWRALLGRMEEATDCRWFDALDCGSSVGHAMMALTQGQKNVILQTDSRRMDAVRSVCEIAGGLLFFARPPSFDLTAPLSSQTHLAAYFARSYCEKMVPGNRGPAIKPRGRISQ
ncbi:hypothetical protein [Acetobacter farinalis]|nr:hypothetical protein [Acetobacter farinalis]